MSNTLQVGQTYTSENGSEWECIFVRDRKAWMLGVYLDGASGAAYEFDIDGTASWAGGLGADAYNIKWEPKRETVKTRFSIGVWNKDDVGGSIHTDANITFDLIDGNPDWTTAKVTPCD